MTSYTESEDLGLEQFDDEFEATKPADTQGEDVPNGDYSVRVQKAEVAKSKSSDATLLKWQMRVLGPKHAGRMVWKNSVISSKSMPYLKAELLLCGLELERLSDLTERCNELAGCCLKVRKTDRGTFINARLTAEEENDGDDDETLGGRSGAADLEDDSPF